MLTCADINLPRQIQLTLECLAKTSINSPVTELALYKLNLYSPNKVSLALSIRRSMWSLIFWVLLGLDPSHQKPFVYSQQQKPIIPSHFAKILPLFTNPPSLLVTPLSLSLQRVTAHPGARQISLVLKV